MPIPESDLILPALKIISQNDGVTTGSLIRELTELFHPSGEDAVILTGRSDTKFSQKVRNLKSHDSLERHGFATYEPGNSTSSGGSWHITNIGQSFLDGNQDNIEALINCRLPYAETLNLLAEKATQGREMHIFDENLVINEGLQQNVTTSAYERSNALRRAAIEHYKQQDGHILCCICGFDFLETYGERGRDFIIIHHEKPLYESEGIGRTTFLQQAIQEVKPVCPNCHSIIHLKRNETLSIQEMTELINS